MPFAPKEGTVFSVTSGGGGTQDGLALLGSPAEAAPITCTVTLVADSPDTGNEISAAFTEPQLKPSANSRHSASTLLALVGSCTAGNARENGVPLLVTASARIRRPIEPVSISMWSMFWHWVVPGTQTV